MNIRLFLSGFLLALFGATLLSAANAQADTAPPRVLLATIDGAIGPATTDYVRRGIERAEAEEMAAMVLRVDTPGGLAAATRDIDKAILASKVPVVVYVWPSGAHAASAGTYILYASHVAAMAPGTNLGAATPVSMGGGSPQPGARPRAAPAEEGAEPAPDAATPSAMERKVIEDSAASIRALAELRGRNAEWAERAVREGVSLTATEALEQGVIEIIASTVDGLLEQLDGREVQLDGSSVVLRTAGAEVVEFNPDWRNRLLSVITNPSIAYLLLLVGLYGLLLEGYNPGALVPGVVGIVCLLLAAYALQVLPVNYVGLALIIVGIALMLVEVFTPSFGVLGLGGLAALVFGSVILFDSDVPGFGVSIGLIAGIAVTAGLGFLITVRLLAGSRRAPVVTGDHELLALPARALDAFTPSDEGHHGFVHVRGERWRAYSAQPVAAGEHLRVAAVEGLRLRVRHDPDHKH